MVCCLFTSSSLELVSWVVVSLSKLSNVESAVIVFLLIFYLNATSILLPYTDLNPPPLP